MSPIEVVGFALATAGAIVILGFAVGIVIMTVRIALKTEVKK